MKTINMNLIKKYINGDNINEFSIEELESDKDFMISVINYTNDFRIYNLCSNELKNDYDFVKYLIFKFNSNKEFIKNVADYYLDNNDSDLETRELNIIMENSLSDLESLKYRINNQALFKEKIVEIELEKSENLNLEKMIGMGFWIIFDDYNSSEIILKYYASNLVDEIFENNCIDLEKMLHNQFKNVDEIERKGLNNYILNVINCYDSTLYSYLMLNLDIIKKYTNEVKNIIKNWNNYNSKDERKKYNKMLELVHNYIYTTDTEMDETELLYYTAEKLGIKEKVSYYDGYDENAVNNHEIEYLNDYICSNDLDEDELEKIEFMIKNLEKEEIEYEIDYYIENIPKEKLIYFNVRKIIINQIFSNNPSDNLDDIIKDNPRKLLNGKGKVLKFKNEN